MTVESRDLDNTVKFFLGDSWGTVLGELDI
jgi:hypothetical protein